MREGGGSLHEEIGENVSTTPVLVTKGDEEVANVQPIYKIRFETGDLAGLLALAFERCITSRWLRM